ncbi:MAG TPA: heavy-metal-associated domain-containing protein [Anaerolineaceae bacterium]|nr:heavy-metal-associated domain-containing protein [Anaerolineaceae bacterium]
MKNQNYKISAISCKHCIMHIKEALMDLEGVNAVEGDLPNKAVEVEFTAPATDEKIRATLAEIGYPAQLEA